MGTLRTYITNNQKTGKTDATQRQLLPIVNYAHL